MLCTTQDREKIAIEHLHEKNWRKIKRSLNEIFSVGRLKQKNTEK